MKRNNKKIRKNTKWVAQKGKETKKEQSHDEKDTVVVKETRTMKEKAVPLLLKKERCQTPPN